MKSTMKLFRMAMLTLASLSLIWVHSGCDADMQRALEAAASEAKPEISGLGCTPGSTIINDQLDFGYHIIFSVKNVGKAGVIRINPWLSSSEGEWSRTQKLTFKEGESMDLTYFFHEPTISATNLQYGVNFTPSL